MGSYTAEDHKKFVHALGARDVRRVTALIQRLDLDPVTYNEIACHLDKFEARLFTLAFVSCHPQDGEHRRNGVDDEMTMRTNPAKTKPPCQRGPRIPSTNR